VDAVVIDSTGVPVEDVVGRILDLARGVFPAIR
jgi:cytidylate kinase